MPDNPIVTRFQNEMDKEWKSSVLSLFERSFERKMSSRYLDWRYFDGTGNSFFSFIGKSDFLLSSYSVASLTLSNSYSSYQAALSMTTMTHPSARGRGYFPLLADDVYKTISKKGIGFVIGFMNSFSHKIFIRDLNWSDIYEIPTLKLNLSKSAVHSDYQSTSVKKDSKFELDYEPLKTHGLITAERSTAYLRWRYSKHPINQYENYAIEDG
jgi:hypothetical protein